MKPEDFAGSEPSFRLEEYFVGKTRAWGLFEDRFGDIRRQFLVDIVGTWDGQRLILEEDFVYADGETDRRVWRIRKIDDHHYEGTADDVVGTAKGIRYGNALNWRYQLDLPVKNRTWRVTFDDWMLLQPDGVLMNRARVSKWGLEIGQVTLTFQRMPATEAISQGAENSGKADPGREDPLNRQHPAPEAP